MHKIGGECKMFKYPEMEFPSVGTTSWLGETGGSASGGSWSLSLVNRNSMVKVTAGCESGWGNWRIVVNEPPATVPWQTVANSYETQWPNSRLQKFFYSQKVVSTKTHKYDYSYLIKIGLFSSET